MSSSSSDDPSSYTPYQLAMVMAQRYRNQPSQHEVSMSDSDESSASNPSSSYTPYQLARVMAQRYMDQPSQHVGQGAAGDVDHVGEMSDEEEPSALPALNVTDPHDYYGSPISADHYMKIDLSPEYSNILSVYIKRHSFISKNKQLCKICTFKYL